MSKQYSYRILTSARGEKFAIERGNDKDLIAVCDLEESAKEVIKALNNHKALVDIVEKLTLEGNTLENIVKAQKLLKGCE